MQAACATSQARSHKHRKLAQRRDLNIISIRRALLKQPMRQWPRWKDQVTDKARRDENSISPAPEGKASFVNTLQQAVAAPGQAAGLSS